MAKRKLESKLVDRDQIAEEIRLIEGTKDEYITPTGKIFKDYGKNKFYPKKNFINKTNGYLYCNIIMSNGVTKQFRVHVLVAKTYLSNPENLPVVLHKDNNKANPSLDNLKWGTVSENTKSAYEQGLAKNAKGYEDSQSMPIYCFDMNKRLIKDYGSAGEASRDLNITKTTILNQCKHKMKTKPRCGFYFMFQDDFNKNGFNL